MKCWICGGDGDSAEHRIKASDVKDVFGLITTRHPLYRQADNGPYEIVHGLRSTKLKFASLLCSNCNTARTQKHDESWKLLSRFLRNRQPTIAAGDVIRLSDAFPDGIRKRMLWVHLYFLKIFGCQIIDGGVPIETKTLADAILTEKAHPNVYLSFLAATGPRSRRYIANSPVHVGKVGQDTVCAYWFYMVGSLVVNIAYANAVRKNNTRVHLWHPTYTTKSITIDTFGKI